MTDEERKKSKQSPTEQGKPSFTPGFLETVAEVRCLTDKEIIERHDIVVDRIGDPLPAAEKQPYLEQAQRYFSELTRREAATQAEKMEKLTKSINLLTWVITVATIVGIGLAAVSLWLGV